MKVQAPVDGVLYAPYTQLNFTLSKVAIGSVVRPGDKILEIPDLSSYNLLMHLRQKMQIFLSLQIKLLSIQVLIPKELCKQKLLGNKTLV